MKHFKHLCMLLTAMLLSINVWGETATFGSDWNTLFGTSYTGSVTGIKANQFSLSGTSNNVTMAVANGSSTNGYVKTGDFRAYNGYTITLTAPTDNNITSITSTKGGKTFSTGVSANVGTCSISNNTISWTGEANSVVLSISGTVSFATIVVTYSTSGSSETTVNVTDVSLDKTSLTLAEGATETLIATIAPDDATNKNVNWESSNESVATVANGVVTAKSAGSAIITVKSAADATKTATCNVTVNAFTPTAGEYEIALNNAFYGVSTGNNGTEQSAVAKGITVVSGCTSSASSKTYYDTDHIRYYKDSYLKLTAPDGFEITKVVFTANGTWNAGPTVTFGSYDNNTKTWTGNAAQLDMSFAAQNRAESIKVTYAVPATLQSITISGEPTKKEYTAGENFNPAGLTVTGNYSDESQKPITEGITWSEPAALTAGQTSVSITATVAGITSAAYEVTGLTVAAAKNLDYIALNTESVKKIFWKGETFNHTGLVVTAYYADETNAVVEPLSVSTPDMTLFNQAQTITVSYKEGGVTKEATYNIEVKTIANTQETAYTTAEAIALIDAGKDLSTEVYVKGKVSQVDSYNSKYKSITYWLDDNAFEVYAGLAGTLFDGEFSSEDDIAVGADVIVKGTIKKYNSTYEFDKNNVLVYYLAPEVVKENPTLTLTGNKTAMSADDADNEFTVSYDGDGELTVTSSNEAVAEAIIINDVVLVEAKTAGTTTITVSAAETATYNAVSKSYTLNVSSGLSAATLPFSFDGGKADMNVANGIKNTGLGSDNSSAPKLKFDDTNDEVVIRVAEAIKKVEYTIKGNTGSGAWSGQFDVLQSADGKTYTSLASHTSMASSATKMTSERPAAATRYIKFVLTTKTNGNVALGAIKITAASVVDPAELAFEKDSYRFVTTNEMIVAAASKAGSTGTITYSCEDANLTIDAETGVITCTTAGTYTINAAIAATADYEAGNASCTVTIVEPAVANSIIVAEADGKVFAMTNTLNGTYVESVEIKKFGDKYLVETDEIYNSILYTTATADGKTTIVSQSNQYLQTTAAKSVSFTDEEYKWTNANGVLTAAEESHGTLQYNVGNPRFTTYASKVGQYATIVSLDDVVIGEKWTRDLNGMGTHCYPYTIKAGEYQGASFYIPAYRLGTSKLYWDEVAADEDIEAGKPYLVVPDLDSEEVIFVKQAETVDAPVVVDYGMVGNFAAPYMMVPAYANNYIVLDNQFRLAGNNVAIGQYRAYIHLEDVTDHAVAPAPGRRRIEMNNADATVATGIENLNGENMHGEPMKVLINGQVFILRGAKMYNAQGQLVK